MKIKKDKNKKKRYSQFKLLNKKYLKHNSTNINISPEVDIERALDRFSISSNHAINYTGFINWLSDKIKPSQVLSIYPVYREGTINQEALYLISFINLFKKYTNRIQFLQNDTSVNRNILNINNNFNLLNKYKLLLGFSKELNLRGNEIVNAVLLNDNESIETDTDLDSHTQAQLRLKLFSALYNSKEEVAFKILGKLQEAAHDLDELKYIEALCYFKMNKFTEAIRFANKVGINSIDYPAVLALLLETYAFQGDISSFITTLQKTSSDSLLPSFMAYLVEVLLNNSINPEQTIIKIIESKVLPSSTISIDKVDSFLPIFNRYTCSLAVEILELYREEELALLAIEQGKGDPLPVNNNISILSENIDENSNIPLRKRQLLYALNTVDSNFLDKILSSDDSEVYKEIVKRLINVPYNTEFQDYRQALITQYRLGAKDAFINNVASELTNIVSIENEGKWELIELSFREALILNHPVVSKLEIELNKHPLSQELINRLKNESRTNRIIGNLSPMGRLSYEASILMQNEALKYSASWKDAGMISLGFYRILELEFNELLIKPMRKSLNQDELNERYSNFINLFNNTENNTKNKYEGSLKKAKKVWERLLPQILDVLRNKKQGLELGNLELLLSKTENISGADSGIKEIISNCICASLNEKGAKAYRSGELRSLINRGFRERYRNPPAHTRFLPLSIAQECKNFVDNALELLNSWKPI
jgi:hypothetical protein